MYTKVLNALPAVIKIFSYLVLPDNQWKVCVAVPLGRVRHPVQELPHQAALACQVRRQDFLKISTFHVWSNKDADHGQWMDQDREQFSSVVNPEWCSTAQIRIQIQVIPDPDPTRNLGQISKTYTGFFVKKVGFGAGVESGTIFLVPDPRHCILG